MKTYVLVTGACVNTGAAIVEKFASERKNVIFTGRNAEHVAQAEKRYREKFPEADIFGRVLDSLNENGEVDEKSVISLFEELDEKDIFADTLVLNAADLGVGVTVFESPLKDFKRVIDTNVCWNYLLAEQAASRMKSRNGGSITFINSNTAYRAIPDRVAYETSKGGQLGLMRALAFELGKYNVRVNAVLPGMIRTDRTDKNPDFYKSVPSAFSPLRSMAEGADIADAVWYFAEHAKFTTGAELVVDGGNSIQLYPIIPEKKS